MPLAVAAYVALAVVISWPYFSYSHPGSASYGGDARLIIWTLAWDNHAILSGQPLFQSNLFFPAADSLRYNEHLFGVSLFTLPWAAAGASPVLAYNVTWWLAWPLNGLAAFFLLRRFTGDELAAFAGSLGFVCSFYVMSHAHGHLHLIWMWPLPLSMLLLERWFVRPGWGRLLLWTLVFVLGALTSWYVAVMMLIVNGLTGVVLTIAERAETHREASRRAQTGSSEGEPYKTTDDFSKSTLDRGRWPRRVVQLTVAAVLVLAAIGPFARHYVGLRGAPGEAAANSATLASYLVPPANTLVGEWWTTHIDDRPGSIWGETTLFAGWITLALALIGLMRLLSDRTISRRAWIFPVLAASGFLISLGPAPAVPGGPALAPFAWLVALPGFEGLRAPARFGIVMMLGVSGLAALGAVSVGRLRRELLVLLIPLMLGEWFVVDFPAGKPTPYPVPAIYQTPEVRSARSLISLPEYWGTTDWVLGGDYLYYSMSHWRPIVNGFGRTGPPGYDALIDDVRNFPASVPRLRSLGVQYVVLHAGRYPNHGQDVVAQAQATPGCRLVRTLGEDYLFEILAPLS